MKTTAQMLQEPFWYKWKKSLDNLYQLGVKPEYDHFLRSSIIYFNYDVFFGILLLFSAEVVFLFLQPQGIDLVHGLSVGYMLMSFFAIYLNAKHRHSLSVLLLSTYAIFCVAILSGYYGERSNIHFLLFIFGFSPIIHLARNFSLALVLSALFIGTYLFLVLMNFSFFPGVQLSPETILVIRKYSYPIILSAFLYKVLLTIFIYSESVDALLYKSDRLLKSEATLNSVFQNTTDAVWAMDTNYRFLAFNQVAEKEFKEWFGVQLVIGETPLGNIPLRVREKLKDVFVKVFNGEAISIEEERYFLGKTDTFVLSFTPISDKFGAVIGCTGFSKNVTKFRQAQAELLKNTQELQVKNQQLEHYIESNMQLENFAYIASHDMKEPLRAIIIYSQLLNQHYRGLLDENGKEFLDFILSSSSDMNRMINDLLEYAKINSEEPQFEEVDFPLLLKSVQLMLSKTIEETNAEIRITNLPNKIIGTSTRLKQVIQNLVSNSMKFRNKETPLQIQIRGEEYSNYWKIMIEDNGIGIKPEFHEEVFQLFRRLHSKRKFQGTGIGLTICKKIVEQHQGIIGVESVLGEGSTFYFTISKKLQS